MFNILYAKKSESVTAAIITHLVIIITGHDVGERDLSLEHLSAVHELHQQVTDRLKLHPFRWLYV